MLNFVRWDLKPWLSHYKLLGDYYHCNFGEPQNAFLFLFRFYRYASRIQLMKQLFFKEFRLLCCNVIIYANEIEMSLIEI